MSTYSSIYIFFINFSQSLFFKVIDARVAMKLYQLQKFQWEHAHGAQWSDQKRGDHKWLPRGRRAQQKKKGTLHSYSSRQEEGADRVIEPFNVMLHTE